MTEYICGMAGATGGSLAHAYGYTYDDASGTMSAMTVTASGVSDTMSFTYDALQRLTAKNTVRTGLTLAQEHSYKTISGNRTSTLISGVTQKVNGSTLDSYTYTYDSLGNITAINRNGTGSSYVYDVQNQLTVSAEGYISYQYTYDTYGNILSVKKYDNENEQILLSTDTYTYGNAQWLDQLTAFNGVSITYDGIGNPLSYYNGSSYTFTWSGRELATAVKGGVTTTYKYGADGLRTQKTVGSTVYNYYYADGLLVRQTWGSNYIDFLYDEKGMIYSCVYNGTQYYYVRNLQGDVVKILNTSGTTVVAYSYDAWGKCTVTTGASNAIANANPIRYRGYYYDTDTGFYYLQSRYYDPAIKRFINEDSYINANCDFIGFNMYVYCSNNPVNFIDDDGESATAVFQTWLSGGWAVALAEPTVFGEIIYGAGIVLFGIAATIETVIVAETLANRIYDICEYRATVSATSSELAFIDSASTAATPPPPNKGGRGTRTNSTTLYNKKGIHIDVENSGNRIGQIHLQKGAQKYYYNVAEKVFRTGSSAGELAPRAIQELLKDPAVIKAIAKGLKILGY